MADSTLLVGYEINAQLAKDKLQKSKGLMNRLKKTHSSEVVSHVTNAWNELESILKSEGLNAPASVAASITAYRSEMDTVAGFIEDECHQDPSQRSSVASLYEQYASWCKAQDKHPRTKVQFGTALKSQGYAQVRDSTGRHWQGLSISILG